MGQEIEFKKLDGNNSLGGRLFITGIDRGIIPMGNVTEIYEILLGSVFDKDCIWVAATSMGCDR